MILPIYAYGQPVLKKVAEDIDSNYPELQQLLENMKETMENAGGVGLAAPQVGLPIRVFLVDTFPFDGKDVKPFKKTFINAKILKESGANWSYSEGCLSIPEIREDITRKEKITIEYLDENFKKIKEDYEGIAARIILHEYDHIEGVLFTDYLSPLKKRMLKKSLDKIAKGEIELDYKMKFVKAKRR